MIMDNSNNELMLFLNICEKLGWSVSIDDAQYSDVELKRWAANGLECFFGFNVGTNKNFYERAIEAVSEWQDYDLLEEYEIRKWCEVPPVLDDCYECKKHLFLLHKALQFRSVEVLPKCHCCGTILGEMSYKIDSKPNCCYCSPKCIVKDLTGEELHRTQTVFGENL